MLSYDERLKRETIRRDAALIRMHDSGVAAAAVAQAKLDQTGEAIRAFVRREIERTSDVVSAQIDHAKDVYGRELEHTRTTIDTTIDDFGSRLNLANIVRAHPWGTTVGALVGAILLAPLVKKLCVSPASAPDPASPNGTSTGNNGTQHSTWKPLTDALLASLPLLVATLLQRVTQTAEEPPSAPVS